MRYNRIHIILPIMMLTVACATSCKSEPEPESVSGEQLEIEVSQPASRVGLTTDKNITKLPFSLFGDVYRTGEYFQGLKVIFNGDKVKYENSKWTYGKPIYWLMGQEHSFVALHPSTDILSGISESGISDLDYSGSTLSFTYTIPTNADGIIDYYLASDMLVATHRRKYNFDAAGAVKFEFQHLMSRINISPALDEVLMYEDETEKDIHPDNKDEYILFHKIEIYGLKTTASFSFTPASLPPDGFQTYDIIKTYELDEASVADAVLTFATPKKVTNNKKNTNICDDDDAMFVLPQGINQDTKVVLYYTVNDDNPWRTITFSFSDLPIEKWEAGKSYTYMFTIEKAYTGQIKDGSLKWVLTDISDRDAGDRWINEDGTIRQDFDI